MNELLANVKLIRSRLPLTKEEGKTITTAFVYVSRSRPLPAVGDFAIAESEINHEQFPAIITEVFKDRHGYVARVDLS